MERDVLLKYHNKSGCVVIRRKRKINGTGYSYTRVHKHGMQLKQKARKNMVNQKNQAVLLTLNLIEAGLTIEEIRDKLFLGELEVDPETIEYYRAEKKCPGSGIDPKKAKAERLARERADREASQKQA